MPHTRNEKAGATLLPNRRDFLRGLASGGVGIGLLSATYGLDHIRAPLWEQYVTWGEVDCAADLFMQKYGAKLARLQFGANLCPDYKLLAAEADPDRSVRLLKEYFGCTHVRLGMWWRTHDEQGLSAYNRWIEALLKYEIKTILAYGIKAPFPPETHFPESVKQQLEVWGAKRGSTIHADSPLGQAALTYTQELLEHLRAEFGLDSFHGFNPENEFDAHYGEYALGIGEDLLNAHAGLLAASGRRRLLINTALISPPFRPASLATVVKNALALRQQFPTLEPIVGADVYEETGSGRLGANAYVDTFAGVRLRHGNALLPQAKSALAAAGIPLEVTEFQISEWIREPRRHEPGSRIHTQYLLARIADYLMDDASTPAQEPFIVRLWEMSNILMNMLDDEQFFYTNDAYSFIQAINRRAHRTEST